MSGSFDNNGSEPKGAGKRPAPRIEGTATEVSVKPDRDEPATGEPTSGEQVSGESVPDASREPGSEKGASTAKTRDDIDTPAPAELGSNTGAPPERRSFAAVLLGGLTSLFSHAFAGLVGGLAVLLAISLGYLPLGAFRDTAGIGLIEDPHRQARSGP